MRGCEHAMPLLRTHRSRRPLLADFEFRDLVGLQCVKMRMEELRVSTDC